MNPLKIQAAQPGDAADVIKLIHEAIEWLGELGTDQWQEPRFSEEQRIHASIGAGTTWVIFSDHRAVGTVVVDERADPEFWTSADDPDSALYLHRMVVARSQRGTDLGSAVLDWAGRMALKRGKSRLRLDAWSSNERLHDYYIQQGFRLVRILNYSHRGSGALFERDAETQLGRGPVLV